MKMACKLEERNSGNTRQYERNLRKMAYFVTNKAFHLHTIPIVKE
jgi:hypothetical protein